MKKLLFTLLLAVAVLSMASLPAYADKPTEVSGHFDYLVDFPSIVIRTAGPNQFLYASDQEWWVGDIEGYVPETEFVVRTNASGLSTFQSLVEFEGTVLGSEPGTLQILLLGKQEAGEWWYGTWVILSGTGGLANAHGEGVWYGPGMLDPGPDCWYEGQVHFDP